MRTLAILLAVAIAACSAKSSGEPIVTPAVVRASTFDVAFLDRIDGKPATHIAVGGKLRVRATEVISSSATGAFTILPSSDDTFVITATGAGDGAIEIETTTGYTRFAVSAAPIARVDLVFDMITDREATVALRDARGQRLVDASLRVASGSAPVAFLPATWDRVQFATLPPGDVYVTTDLLGTTRAAPTSTGLLARR